MTKKRVDHPKYALAIQAYLANDLVQVRSYLADRTITGPEAVLMEARLLVKEGRCSEAESLLARLKIEKNDFLEGERAFVRGSSAFFDGDFETAALHNLKARSHYAKCEDQRGEFLSLYNVSVDYQRLGLLRVSDHYLAMAESRAERSDEKLAVYRAYACQFGKSGNFAEACSWIERCLKARQELIPEDRAALMAIAGDIFFRAGDIARATELLREICGSKQKLREKSRAFFCLRVLESWSSGEPLAPAPEMIKRSEGQHLKWEILRAVQGGEKERSERLWKKLVLAEPGTFAPDFRCLIEAEEKDVFFAYLSKLRKPVQLRAQGAQALTGKLARIDDILSQAGAPIRREELIEAVWETPYDPSYDSRFYKLMERYRRTSNRRLVCKNYAYSLE